MVKVKLSVCALSVRLGVRDWVVGVGVLDHVPVGERVVRV